MRLFIWRNVLCDYKCGSILVIAKNVDDARRMAIDSGKLYGENQEVEKEPEVHELNQPFCHVQWGGG